MQHSLPTIQSTEPGFTLVEFIVIMSIFTVMVGVVLFNFNNFRSAVTLENLAHDIALSIRQVQTSAGASISAGDPTSEVPRGIYFPVTDEAYDPKFILFQDNNGDHTYTPDYLPAELIDTINISTPDRIVQISESQDTVNEGIPLNVQGTAITFKRFYTDAIFDPLLSPGNSWMRIKLLSPDRTLSHYVSISVIGQVSIQ